MASGPLIVVVAIVVAFLGLPSEGVPVRFTPNFLPTEPSPKAPPLVANVSVIHNEQPAKAFLYERCVIVHGIGGLTEAEPTATDDSHPNTVKSTPQCKEHVFIHEDTNRQAWFDDSLSRKVCKHILPHDNPDNIVRNSLIFSHSMGTIVLAAAIEAGYCDIDSATSSWNAIAFAPPVITPRDVECSAATAFRTEEINSLFKKFAPTGVLDFVLDPADPNRTQWSRATNCLDENELCTNPPTVERRERVLKIAQEKVSAASCGGSGLGIKKYDTHFACMDKVLSKCGEKSDGCVTLNQCMRIAPGARFESHPSARYYVGNFNHDEAKCYRGDGKGDDEKPCAWMGFRT